MILRWSTCDQIKKVMEGRPGAETIAYHLEMSEKKWVLAVEL